MNRRDSSLSRHDTHSPVSRSSRSRESTRRNRITERQRNPTSSYGNEKSHNRSRSHSVRRKSRRSHSRSRSHSMHRRKSNDHRKSYSHSPFSERRRHVGTRDNPQQSRCLGVFGLSVNTTEQKIYHMFSKFGPIQRVQLVIDAKTNRSRGFCFVYFESAEDAKEAKDKICGVEVDDRRIRVDYSITQRAHTPTPGVYMGKPTRLYREKEYHDRYRNEEYRSEKYRRCRGRSPSPYYRKDRSRRYRKSYSRSRSHDHDDR